jgi:signal transduction histidine kinase
MALSSWRVLLVDDDEDDYFLTGEMLSQALGRNILLDWAPNYETAQEKINTETFDAVLVDYNLGARSGIEFIRELSERNDHPPAILLTGQGSYEVDVEAMQAGANLYLTKTEANPLLLERTIRYAIERKQAEVELKARNEEIHTMTQQLWQTAKLATMGELAASVAHELNNPLAILSLRVELLANKIPEDSPGHSDLEIMEQEIERMAALVSNLLNFTRPGERQISSLDICEEIDQTLELMHSHLIHRNISVQRDYAPERTLVQADRQQMRQVFLNLFTNANDAMQQGGILTVRVRPGSGKSPVVIEVQDTGAGIPAEDLPRLMEPFFSTKPEGKGTGLGLAICRRIVEKHQGSIQISSPGRDQGTTVQITLPGANSVNVSLGKSF